MLGVGWCVSVLCELHEMPIARNGEYRSTLVFLSWDALMSSSVGFLFAELMRLN